MRLQVTSVTRVAHDVVAIELVDPSGGDLPAWEPGAHVDLVLDDGLIRQYSLCSSPDELATYRIAVLLEETGRGGSSFVHTRVAPGTSLEVRGPRNHFALEPAGEYLFLAGGIGITPLLAMIGRADALGATFRVVYLGRARDRMAFLPELARFGDRVAVVARDESDRMDLGSLLADLAPGALVYSCGPEGLIAEVEAIGAHRTDLGVHVERFVAPPAQESDASLEFEAEHAFEVELASSGEVLHVPADRTLLDVLEEAGADVYSDCREGICSTCETVVISGRPDHRDHVLTAAERESNAVMMVCVSRACSDRIVLDL